MSAVDTPSMEGTVLSSDLSHKPIQSYLPNRDELARKLNTEHSDDYSYAEPGKAITFYIMNPKALRDEHQYWYSLYLVVLISAAFCAIFVGPIMVGMLAAISGIGTPIVLSLVGSTLGLFAGLVLGVVFAVVCIIALVRAIGWGAEWVLDTLWCGGSDLYAVTRKNINSVINPEDY